MKKNGISRAVFLGFLWCTMFLISAAVEAAPLPDVMDEWQSGPIHTTTLDVGSEDLGTWRNRVYTRTSPIASIEVNLTEGPGFGTLFVPDTEGRTDDAPIGFSSTYETLNIADKRAILERGDVTGQALAVAFDKNMTLTLESKSVSAEELLDFAERLIRALQAE